MRLLTTKEFRRVWYYIYLIYLAYLIRSSQGVMVIFFFICKQKAIIAQALIIAVYLVEHSLHSRIMSTVRSKMLSISLSGLHLVKTFAVIIFLSNRCFAQEVDPVPPNNIAINGAYITLNQYASGGPKIGRHTCWSLLQCAHLCATRPKCSSFNYQVLAARNALCELSNESITSSEERDKLKKMHGFVFVQIMRKDLVSFRSVP